MMRTGANTNHVIFHSIILFKFFVALRQLTTEFFFNFNDSQITFSITITITESELSIKSYHAQVLDTSIDAQHQSRCTFLTIKAHGPALTFLIEGFCF